MAQRTQRARITGGGSGGEGRCIAEVVVDGAAELQIQGENANLRNLSGAEPQWRRFECTSPMPANADVRVNVNGRGRAQLISSPRNGGPAVVRIEDSEGGANVYQMELQWTGGNGAYGAYNGNNGYNNQPNNQGRFGRVSVDQAVENCRQSIRQEARSRFGTENVEFRQIDVDNQQGNRDLVVGTVGIRRDTYPFSCTMNLNNGRVREARINGVDDHNRNTGYAGRDVQAREMDTCRSAVMDRIGGDRVEFGPMNVEDRSGNDLVRGTARQRGRDYEFSCSVNSSGAVRDVNVRGR